MILNPSRTHTTHWQHHSFQKPFSEIALHQVHIITVLKRKEIEYAWALQSRRTKVYKDPVLFHT